MAMTLIKGTLIWAVYFPLSLLTFLLGVRFVVLTNPGRIGHLCIEPDCFLKERMLGLQPRFKAIFLIPRNAAANQVLLRMWQEKLTMITSPFLCRLLVPIRRFAWADYAVAKYAVAIDSTAAAAGILSSWTDRPPLLAIDDEMTRRGFEVLRKLGMPKDAWFVCIHSRDGSYSPADEHLHSYRNSSIESYALAIEEVARRGGWCIRVGEPASAPLRAENFIDYANSTEKSEWMDIFLCAKCRFFLGNSSGLFFLSMVFGRPSATANMVPVSCALPLAPGDIGVPKLLRSKSSGQPLSFPEIFASPIANFRFTWQYEEAGVALEENSPEDIRDLAQEMLDRLAGTSRYDSLDEELQERFRKLLHPGHYAYGARSRIGSRFLRSHAALV